MGKPKRKDLPDLSHLARTGSVIEVRVTPRADRNAIVATSDTLNLRVTAPPEAGKANDAVRALLAKAMQTAPSNLELRSGASSRRKCFAYIGP